MFHSGKILAIDFGRKSIGLAVSDEDRQMAFGRGVFQCKNGLAQAIGMVNKFCVQENIKEIVVGLPYGQEGEETPQTARIRRFAQALEEALPKIPIHFQDESFTSFEANEFLDIIGVKARNRKKSEDELAAVFILKRYLKLN